MAAMSKEELQWRARSGKNFLPAGYRYIARIPQKHMTRLMRINNPVMCVRNPKTGKIRGKKTRVGLMCVAS